jgi:hypothetical protein
VALNFIRCAFGWLYIAIIKWRFVK